MNVGLCDFEIVVRGSYKRFVCMLHLIILFAKLTDIPPVSRNVMLF